MSSADRTGLSRFLASWLRTGPYRYGFALIVVGAAVVVQRVLESAIGFPHSFFLFYPAIFTVALLAGFWPGVVGTAVAGLAASYFYRERAATPPVSDEAQLVGLALFGLIGVVISWLASSFRQRANRLQEFEKVVEGLEEMIVVVDRNYRYLIANRPFLQYRGNRREDVIGRHVTQVLDAGVFESNIKPKLDECFRGRVVRYEMTYNYPRLGERQLTG